MSQALEYTLRRLYEFLDADRKQYDQRITLIQNTINQILVNLGAKPIAQSSTTQVQQTLTSDFTNVERLLNELVQTGIKTRPFSGVIPVYLYGNVGLTKNGQVYKFAQPVDYIVIVPTVQAIININNNNLGDQIPPIYANGMLAGYIKTQFVAYKASNLVPDSVLPAPLLMWGFYY